MTLFLLCMLLIVATQVGDYLTTVRALKHRNLREGNPVVQHVGLIPIKVGFVIVSAVVLGLFCFGFDTPTPALTYTGATVAAFSFIIWHNIRLTKRA
jgi:hypothetical protein